MLSIWNLDTEAKGGGNRKNNPMVTISYKENYSKGCTPKLFFLEHGRNTTFPKNE